MTINPTYKNILLYAMLIATLLASAYTLYVDSVGKSSHKVIMPKADRSRTSNIAIDKKTLIEQNAAEVAKVDIFEVYKKVNVVPKALPAIKTEVVKKVVVIDPEPVAVTPTAPPVPFKYIGKIWGDDEFQVFVGFKGKYLVVKEGDLIQKTYKIEKIAPPIMTVTYMPMNILQNMQIGEIN
jgi:hypothetical protein